MRVLLVEDEAEMAAWLVRAFKQSGFVPDHAPDAGTAESLLAGNDYDAIVLDLRLPDKHGLNLLADIRKAGNRTPVLVLTAQGSLQDRVKGLNVGADDFLTKPFAIEELEARIAALVRRSRGRSHAPTTAAPSHWPARCCSSRRARAPRCRCCWREAARR
jgi:two-component system response regulator TctD